MTDDFNDDIDWGKLEELAEGLDLLDVKPKNVGPTPTEKSIAKFQEIVAFFEKHGRKPNENSNDPIEISLGARLNRISRNAHDRETVRPYDKYKLVDYDAPVDDSSTAEQLGLVDELGLLDSDDDNYAGEIFNLVHVGKPDQSGEKVIHKPDFVAQKIQCRDFENFKPLFDECHRDLKSGQRILIPFRGVGTLQRGTFVFLNGVLTYVAEKEVSKQRNERKQARLRCIMENGTETNVLNYTLAKNFYRDGKIVSPKISEGTQPSVGEPTGHIYILSSHSKAENIRAIPNLYKIGVCTTTVKERIKNALFETTYLCANVKIVDDFLVYNVNPQKFEKLLHDFFSDARVSIDVYDTEGTKHVVREWFQIPLDAIYEAIDRVVNNEILNCHYDREKGKIVEN